MRNEPPSAAQCGRRTLGAEAFALRGYIAVVLAAMALCYSTYLIFEPDVVAAIGHEDSAFENMTVVSFLMGSALFLASFLRSPNGFFLLLSLALFVGGGEEMSWGQRLFGFATPPAIDRVNVQEEFSVHNLVWVNSTNMDGTYKQGLRKVLTVNFLYKLFWLAFGVLIPAAERASRFIASFLRALRFPVAPLPIGILFLVNWLTFRSVLASLRPGEIAQYYVTAGEARECLSALIFMMLGFWFLSASPARPPRTAACAPGAAP